MTDQAFTARNVTKFIATSIVAAKAANLTADAITDHTHFEEDDYVVNIGSHVFGWYISSHTKPYTDKIVDKAADFVTAKRIARAAKKNAQKQD